MTCNIDESIQAASHKKAIIFAKRFSGIAAYSAYHRIAAILSIFHKSMYQTNYLNGTNSTGRFFHV